MTTEPLDTLTHIRRYRAEYARLTEQLNRLDAKLTSTHISNMSSTPISGGGSRTEDVWIAIIEKKRPVETRLAELTVYIRRFNRGWAALDEDEQDALEAFYIIGGYGCIANVKHAGKRATVYNVRKRALQKYIKAYGGKHETKF